MIPAAVLLIILVTADAISHITLWLREGQRQEDVRLMALAMEQLEARVEQLERRPVGVPPRGKSVG